MLHIFRRVRHLGDDTGIQATDTLSWLWARIASGMNRLAKARSCFWRTSLAMVADDMTIVVMLPSLRVIIGP